MLKTSLENLNLMEEIKSVYFFFAFFFFLDFKKNFNELNQLKKENF